MKAAKPPLSELMALEPPEALDRLVRERVRPLLEIARRRAARRALDSARAVTELASVMASSSSSNSAGRCD